MQTRQKFVTRVIVLESDDIRERAIAAVRNAPLGIEVVLREKVKERGLDQNGYYFMRLGEIAKQAWFTLDGVPRQFSKDTWHEYARKNIMPETITTKEGEIRSKWEESPDGSMTVISTTQLEKHCFAEYTTAVEAFGASMGVMFSADPRGRR